MRHTTARFHSSLTFLVLALAGCGRVTVHGEPDASPMVDAVPAAPDAARPDATPPDAQQPDSAVPTGDPCEQTLLADLPHGYLGEFALIDGLGTLTAWRCLGDDCDPRRLYVGDAGLGVEGSLIDGDGVTGLDRVRLRLDPPAQVGYRIHRGVNNNDNLGIHHRVVASLQGEQVLDIIIDAREYEMPPMPLADTVEWWGVIVDSDGYGSGFADGFTLEWASVCEPPPAPVYRPPARF